MYFLIFLAVLALINFHVSRELNKIEMSPFRKKMTLMGIWVIPLFGAFSAWGDVRMWRYHQKKGIPLAKEFSQDAANLLLSPKGISAISLEPFLVRGNQIPIFRWDEINTALDQVSDHQHKIEAMNEAKLAWLLSMREALGSDFHVLETPGLLMLSSLEANVAHAMATYVDNTEKRIRTVLRDLAQFPKGEKNIVLVFDDDAMYYDYVSLYYPDEGEFSFSGGMFINNGCSHFVVKRDDLRSIEPVIAHEMTHCALAQHSLPRWLDEGIAVNTEIRLTKHYAMSFTPKELRQKHLIFWNQDTIQEFWSGKSFDRVDDGNLLSYELARILVEHFGKDWPQFSKFVHSVVRDDAGGDAAHQALALDLGDCVCALLDLPDTKTWSPNPAVWYPANP
jgi:hypothetical protein